MDRLTTWITRWGKPVAVPLKSENYKKILTRLAEYEDTNLMPDDIKFLQEERKWNKDAPKTPF